MLWLPTLRAAVGNVAVLPDTVPVPNVVPPSLNVTVPVAPLVTVAVKVTDCPDVLGLGALVSVVVLAAIEYVKAALLVPLPCSELTVTSTAPGACSGVVAVML